MSQSPLEAFYVRSTKPEFSGTFLNEQLSRELRRDKSLHNVSSSVRAAVINNQDVERLLKREYSTNNLFYILLLVIRWYDYYTVTWSHDVMYMFFVFRVQKYEKKTKTKTKTKKTLFFNQEVFFYIGMLPCFFGGLLWFLLRVISRA